MAMSLLYSMIPLNNLMSLLVSLDTDARTPALKATSLSPCSLAKKATVSAVNWMILTSPSLPSVLLRKTLTLEMGLFVGILDIIVIRVAGVGLEISYEGSLS